MKQLKRLELINGIAYELQEKMSLFDIKSYLGGFSICCKNHTPSYNSKRVFVQEVLSNETIEIISEIAKELNIMKKEANKNIEVFVSKKYNEYITEDNEEYVSNYLPFYKKIKNEQVQYLFAYLDYSFNCLFEYMNDRISTNSQYISHYNAHESRELINLIELKDKFQQVFENTEYTFDTDKEYQLVISECKRFIVKSGGSTIPDTFNKINIIEDRAIFNFKNLLEKNQKDKPIIIKKQNIKDTDVNKLMNKVFIVHGHDNEAKQEIARFVESIGLIPIILHEQASMSMTIIEKIEYYSDEADFAIILYTACDRGRGAKETNIPAKNRARQNVVFEHGYLMAKLGRKNICALVKGDIETPNDISGVVYVSLKKSDAWKIEISKELKACGYSIKSII